MNGSGRSTATVNRERASAMMYPELPEDRRVSDTEIAETFEAIAGRYAGDWGAVKFIALGMAARIRRERLQSPTSPSPSDG